MKEGNSLHYFAKIKAKEKRDDLNFMIQFVVGFEVNKCLKISTTSSITIQVVISYPVSL